MHSRVRLSQPLNRIAKLTAILIVLTSSFDIFLVLHAGGNYRFCQIMTLGLLFLAVLKVVRGARIPVLGAFPLFIWLIVQIVFIPATDFWPKGLAYCLWLLLNLGLVFSCVQLFSDDPKSFMVFLRWYTYSFAFIACFGIIQFILPLLGFRAPLVAQWWIPELLPRVNGFSYEPSYFATYLLIGFVFTGSLRRNHSPLLPKQTLAAIYWLTVIGIVISSSRMGILFMFIDVLLSQFRAWRSFVFDCLRLRIAFFKIRALIPSVLLIVFVWAVAAATSLAIERNPAVALIFLSGTGISDTAAHSVIQREDALEQTFAVFLQHPLLGRSLGGVSIAIAGLEGAKAQSFEASKNFEGMSVFAEALAASGVIGIIPFACFLVTTFRKPMRLARIASPFHSVLLQASLRALLFAWAILQFNQNMLRPYLWTHIAILATVYAATLQSVATPSVTRSSS
jgi:hypothetical protein